MDGVFRQSQLCRRLTENVSNSLELLHANAKTWRPYPIAGCTRKASSSRHAAALPFLGSAPLVVVEGLLHALGARPRVGSARPRAALGETTLAALGADRESLGRATVLAFLRARTR